MPETILDIKSIEIGTDISFKTINPLDNTLYEGKMIGKGNYDIVKNLYDILPYYQAVKKNNRTMDPIDKLEYFIIDYTQDGKHAKFVCAYDWVESSTLKIIDLDYYFDIRIYNVGEQEKDRVIKLLESNQISCSLIEE